MARRLTITFDFAALAFIAFLKVLAQYNFDLGEGKHTKLEQCTCDVSFVDAPQQALPAAHLPRALVPSCGVPMFAEDPSR
jgi:hypothetical protein